MNRECHVNIQSLSIKKNRFLEIISCRTLMYTILSCFVLVVGGTGGSSWKMPTTFPSGENHCTWQWQWTSPVCSISTDSVQVKQYPFKIQVYLNDHPLKHPGFYFVFFSIVDKNPARSLAHDHCAVCATHLLGRNLWLAPGGLQDKGSSKSWPSLATKTSADS